MSVRFYHPKPIPGTPYIPTHPLGPGDPASGGGGLVAHYLLDTPRSDIAYDRAGDNDGVLTGMTPATDWVSNEMGTVLDFDGLDDRIEVTTAAGDLTATNDITVAVLVNIPPAQISWGYIAEKWENATWRLEFSDNNKKIFFQSDNIVAETLVTANVMNDGLWHHIVAVRSATDGVAYLYVDGQQEDSGAFVAGVSADATMRFGARLGGASPLLGQIALVALYSRALSASEVLRLYGDPYCMFQPLGWRPWMQPPGGIIHQVVTEASWAA